MPEYDAFGREVGEDSLSQWRKGSGAPSSEPEPVQRPPATLEPAVVTSGDPLGTATAAPAPPARPAPPAPRRAFGRSRRRRRGGARLIVLIVVGWVAFNVIGNLADEVEDAARTIRVPQLTPPTPAKPPAGLAPGSLLRRAEFTRALADIRRRDIGRLQHLRVAPGRIDATLITPRRTLVNVQVSATEGYRRFSESGPGFTGSNAVRWGQLDPRAPQRLTRAAAERLGRPVYAIDYLVPSLFDGKVTWGAYFKNGAIFMADARGRVTRRVN